VPVGAAWKPEALTAPVASQFIDVLAQACANGNAGSRAPANSRLNGWSRLSLGLPAVDGWKLSLITSQRKKARIFRITFHPLMKNPPWNRHISHIL